MNTLTREAMDEAQRSYRRGDFVWALWKLGQAYAYVGPGPAILWILGCRSATEQALNAQREPA